MAPRSLSHVRVYAAIAAIGVIAAILGPLSWMQIAVTGFVWAVFDGIKELWRRFRDRHSPRL